MCSLLNSRLNVKDGSTCFNQRLNLVPLKNELLVYARMAHSKYICLLRNQKKKIEKNK